MKGKVYLVGAGPGDPELLTVKALRILKSADVVLHDDLISPEILALVSPTAFVYNVGKRCGTKSTTQERINSLLVHSAAAGLQVVRLKGGDPFVFGRGGEEMQALRHAGTEFEIVPGVTSAFGAAAAAQIPLTHRDVSSALVFVTCHHAEGRFTKDWDWRPLVASKATLVIYMPGRGYDAISRKLYEAGMKAETPCVVISRATTADQQVYFTTVKNLELAPRLPAPTLLIVGEVVGLAGHAIVHELPKVLSRQQSVWLQAQSSSGKPGARREQSA